VISLSYGCRVSGCTGVGSGNDYLIRRVSSRRAMR
jgi:hypothetical protein